jgi:hypothetical protein
MKKPLLLIASVAAGAIALAAPASKAMPLARTALNDSIQQAHSVRICDDEGDCWWSTHHRHGGYWDEDRDHGWRHGYRYHDEDHYGRAPRYREEYEERGEYRDHGRYGRADREERGEMDRDRDHERQSMDRDRDRERSAREESRERNREYRSEHETKERGGHESKKD